MSGFKRIGGRLQSLQRDVSHAARNLEKLAKDKEESIAQIGGTQDEADRERGLHVLLKTLRKESRYLKRLHKALVSFLGDLADARSHIGKEDLGESTKQEIVYYLELAERLASRSRTFLETRQEITDREFAHARGAQGKHLISPNEFNPRELEKLKRTLDQEHRMQERSAELAADARNLQKQYHKINKLPEVHRRQAITGAVMGPTVGVSLILLGHPILGTLAWIILALEPDITGPNKKDLQALRDLT